MPLSHIQYYSKNLKEDHDLENLLVDAKHPEIYAKSEHYEDGKVAYYIKQNKLKRLADPFGAFFNKADLSERFQTRMGPKYQFTKVSQGVFDLYIRYLLTRNRTNLSHAERERFGG